MTNQVSLKNINWKLKIYLSLGFAAFLGLLNSIPFLIENRSSQIADLWLSILMLILLGIGFWIVGIHIIWFLEDKFSFSKNRIFKSIIAHLLALLSFSFIYSLWTTSLMFLVYPTMTERYTFLPFSLFRALYDLPFIISAYSAILGVGIGLNYYRKFQERALRSSQLEAKLAQAQLQTLKAQLQPHFVFNTLNGIVGLIRNNKNEAAIEIITELSQLLRYVTENAGKETVELRDELEFNKLYLALHQKRFSNRLQIEMNIKDETLPILIPNLILQPLIENAIIHGIDKSLSAKLISIETKIQNQRLLITIKNDGTELAQNWTSKMGVGLANTFARLEKTYPGDFTLNIENSGKNQVAAKLDLPLKFSHL